TTLTASKQVTVGNGLSDKTVDAGSTLTWTPDGTIEDPGDGSISYQWYGPDGNAISGQTSPTLTLSGVSASDAGSYYLKVSTSNNSYKIGPATLTVNAAETSAAAEAASAASSAANAAGEYASVASSYGNLASN